MLRYQKVESKIWFNKEFRALTGLQQRLYLYLLICPHGNLIGLFILKKGYAAEDLQYVDRKELDADFDAVMGTRFCSYDEENETLWIHNLLDYNPLTNSNQVKGAARIWSLLKGPLKDRFAEKYPELVGAFTGYERTSPAMKVFARESPDEPIDAPATPPPKKESQEPLVYKCDFFEIDQLYHAELSREFPLVDLPDLYKRLKNDCVDNPLRYKRNVRGHIKNLRNAVRNWCLRAKPVPAGPVAREPSEPAKVQCPLCKAVYFVRDGHKCTPDGPVADGQAAKIGQLVESISKNKTFRPIRTDVAQRKQLLREQAVKIKE